MDVQSGILMVLSTLGLLVLLALLILILIKPGRRLKASMVYKQGDKKPDNSIIELKIDNVGKKPMSIVYLYARFYDRMTHRKVLLAAKDISCKLPYFIKKGESIRCDLDIGEYLNSLKEQSFELHSIKIAVANSLSMEYLTNSLEL
jgi:hypothetical protein